MEKEQIRQKCRKVYIIVEDNKIFDYGTGEYEFISVFKEEQKALDTMRARLDNKYEYLKNKRQTESKVVGFYLVPIDRINF